MHLTALDGDLRLRIADSVISATRDSVGLVTGGFAGDTLFVAWEDYREHETAIYGTARGIFLPTLQKTHEGGSNGGDTDIVMPGPPADTLKPAASGSALLITVPVPALDHATAIVNLRGESTATIELVDMLGRRVLARTVDRVPAGENRFDLDLAPLFPGSYFVRVYADGRAMTGRLDIAR